MNWIDYRKKLGLGFSDKDKQQFFIVSMFNVLEAAIECDCEEYADFCYMTGTSSRKYLEYDEFRININYKASILSALKAHAYSVEEFLLYYIAFVNCKRDSVNHDKFKKEDYYSLVINELDRAGIAIQLIEIGNEKYIFPKGVEEFDANLVSEPLGWLSKYPQAEKIWKRALVEYSNVTEDTASNVADDFRKALEEFFRCFFGGNKNYDGYKMEYGKYLKEHGIPTEIANNYMTLIEQYKNYNNSYAKHHDATSIKILEYLMYQTGMLMRLLITVE